MFSIGLYKVHIANLLVWNHLAYSLDDWYLYHLVDPSTRFVKIMPILPKWTHPGGHVFYIVFNRESIEQYSQIVLHYQVCSNYGPWFYIVFTANMKKNIV